MQSDSSPTVVLESTGRDKVSSPSKTNYMNIKRKVKVLISVFVLSVLTSAAHAKSVPNENFDWDEVMEAIIQVESKGNPRAQNGIYAGCMQISPILVKECNNILASRNESKRFTLSDRYSVEKSKDMFRVIQSKHNPRNSVEHAIRSWQGGQRYSVKKTQRYLNKVMSYLR